MRNSMQNSRSSAGVAAATALVLSASTAAGDYADDWSARGTLYLWAAGISGVTAGGGDVDMGFNQLIRHLNFAFMGALEARRRRWSVGADLLYLNVGLDNGGTVPLRIATGDAANLNLSADAETKGWVVTLRGGYNLLDSEHIRLDALFGARYLDLEADLDLSLLTRRLSVRLGIAASVITWDAIAGAIDSNSNFDGPSVGKRCAKATDPCAGNFRIMTPP